MADTCSPHDYDAPASPGPGPDPEELLEELSEAIAVLDGEWRIVRVNRAAEWLLGSDRAELLGRPAWGLLGFARGTPGEASLRRAMAERRRTLHDAHDAASGRWVQVQAWPLPTGLAVRLSDVTERHEAESALRASEERYRLLVERSPEAIAVHRDGVVLYVNRAGATLAAAADPGALAGLPVTELLHPDDHPRIRRRSEEAEDGERRDSDSTEARLVRRDGQMLEVEVVSVPVVYAGRAAIQSVVRDVTERRRAERALREGEARLRDAERRARATAERMRAVASAAAGVMAADSLDALYRVLRGACAAALPFELFSFGLYDAAHHALTYQAGPTGANPAVSTFVAGSPAERVVRERRSLLTLTPDDPGSHGDGLATRGRRPASVIRTPVLAGDQVLGVVSVHSYTPGLYGQQDVEVLEVVAALASTAVRNIRLVEAIRRSEERLAHQAFHDPLTDLANRALFLDRVRHALARRNRRGARVAVLFVDLDDFKKVNDSLGHGAGDRLLVAAAERLCGCVRSADTVARLGGDEFAVLVEDAGDAIDAGQVAERLVDALRAPFAVGGTELFVSASVGVALAARGEGADELLRNADVAMYYAKARRKDGHAVFEPWMHEAVRERLAIEADLRRALERAELALHYQPIVRLDTGVPIGVEALVRWQHPERGAVAPGVFIPVAEETGLIVPLGRWILREACTQARRWQDTRGDATPLRVTINISGRQLQDASFMADVRETLAATGVNPTSLVLEITESVLMQHTEVVLERLRELKALGLSLAIDDFGTGYSSLGYLQRFPIDILKIDKAFVDAVRDGDGDPALARAVIALGDSLGMQTVAEGIEGAAQADGLRRLGCQLGQGYHFARPLPPEALATLLNVTGKGARAVA